MGSIKSKRDYHSPALLALDEIKSLKKRNKMSNVSLGKFKEIPELSSQAESGLNQSGLKNSFKRKQSIKGTDLDFDSEGKLNQKPIENKYIN